MKRIVILVSVLLAALAIVAQTQKPVYYDTFSQKWLDPAKWLAIGPWCDQGNTLECVREIQNGQLRMKVRNYGGTDSDAGFQYTTSQLHFVNPQAINSIAADITVQRFDGVGCAANDTDTTKVIAGIRGTFFNAGSSGDPADDIWDSVYFWIDTNSPKTIRVFNWMDIGVLADLGQYPIGTPLTILNQWDKVNHQFISVIRITGDSGPGKRVVVPYSVPDVAPPANPSKYFLAWSYSLNCTAVQTFSGVEAFYDNVMVNAVPPNQNQQ